MTLLTLLFAFLSISLAQPAAPFQCEFDYSHPLMKQGRVTGSLAYDWGERRMQIDFGNQGYIELYHYNQNRGYGNSADQWVYKTGASCACETTALPHAMPALFASNAYWNKVSGSGVSDQVFTPKGQGDLTELVLSSDGELKSYTKTTGEKFEFLGCSAIGPEVTFEPPTGCKCGKPIDIVLVLDRSGSISVEEFADQKLFITNFADQYDYGQLKANIGITNFNRRVWDSLQLNEGISLRQVQTGVSTVQCCADSNLDDPLDSCCCCGTSISSGIRRGADMFRAESRTRAAKVLVVVTDGNHNTPYDPATGHGSLDGCTSLEQCNVDLRDSVEYAKQNVDGVSIFAVGVGKDRAALADQLLIISDGHPERVLEAKSFKDLAEDTLPLVSQTCDENLNPCGAACCGFCVCGNCQAPTTCVPDNFCESVDIKGSCCKSTPKPPGFCDEPNKCWNYECDPMAKDGKGDCVKEEVKCKPDTDCLTFACNTTTGNCGTTIVPGCAGALCPDGDQTCDDGNACTIDRCDPNTGCVWENLPLPDDGDACTVDICDPDLGNISTPLAANLCDDGNVCTIDRCNPDATSEEDRCIHSPLNCTTDDLCLEAFCDPHNGCETVPIACPLVGECTISGCNVTSGCFVRSEVCGAPVVVGAGVGVGATVGVVAGVVLGVGAGSGGSAAAFGAGAGSPSAPAVLNNPIYLDAQSQGTNRLWNRDA